jgi:hypothetical protein
MTTEEMVGDQRNKFLWSTDELLLYGVAKHACSVWRVAARNGLQRRTQRIRLPADPRKPHEHRRLQILYARRNSKGFDINGPSRTVRAVWELQWLLMNDPDNKSLIDAKQRQVVDLLIG